MNINDIVGLLEENANDIKQAMEYLRSGRDARAVASNNINEDICLVCIVVRGSNLMTGESTCSKLWVVNLAGIERLEKTGVLGERRLTESVNINRLLSNFENVIDALVNNRRPLYRDSNLMHVLQNALEGKSKTLIFVHISLLEEYVIETLGTLGFTTRVEK
ncbi:kinesin-like protein KIN-14E isoform X2 [Rutidosis leptorrhynchoides]|uniref:kinesin-like protein KIN-14E isoform X2 n=1 Tax=Rutidosis leptorrhynchoides TaxID=125765 RepID=UPI003A99555A